MPRALCGHRMPRHAILLDRLTNIEHANSLVYKKHAVKPAIVSGLLHNSIRPPLSMGMRMFSDRSCCNAVRDLDFCQFTSSSSSYNLYQEHGHEGKLQPHRVI